MATETTAPGRVRVVTPPRFVLPAEPAAARVAELLEGVETAEDFTTQAWHKLAVNAVAGLMALSGRRAAMFQRDDARRLGRALAAEALAVARAEGADLPDAAADEIIDWFAALPPDAGTPTLAACRAGRP